jgi:high-affinity iron transporter
MLAAAIIVFREVIEAGLIVGIVLAATRGVAGRGLWVSGGALAGIAGAILVAVFAKVISDALAGVGQELMNASVLAIAVCMLAWHNIWMARHGRELAIELRAAGLDVAAGRQSLAALAIVIAVAVLREGAEVVLFLYGVFASEGTSSLSIVFGALLGLVLGGAVSALTYLGLVSIPTKFLFSVTTTLIAFVTAGMASQCIGFLEQAGYVTILSQTLWDSSAILSDSSIVGRVFHTLLGYNDHPTAMQFIAYLGTLVTILLLTRFLTPKYKPKLQPV